MRVEDDAAALRFDLAHHAAQVFFTLPAHQQNAEGAAFAVGAREVLVLQHVVAEDREMAFDHLGIERLRIGHLQIGPATVGLERLQRGVVERAFVGGRKAFGQQLGLGSGNRDHSAVLVGQCAKVLHGIGRNHREHRVAIRRKTVAHGGVVGRKTRLDGRQQKDVERRVLRRNAEVQRAAIRGEQRRAMHPFDGGAQCHFHIEDHAIRAVGMVHLLDLVAHQFDDARLALHRHHAGAQQVASVTQNAVAERTDATETTRDEAADGGHMPGRWPHAQRLSGLARGHVDVVHACTGFHADAALREVEHTAHLRHVEHDAAFKRHALPVVAGAASAHGDRQLPLGGHRCGLAHVVFGADLHDQIGHAVCKLCGEDRAVPVEVLGQLLALAGRGDEVQAVQIGAHGIPVDGH